MGVRSVVTPGVFGGGFGKQTRMARPGWLGQGTRTPPSKIVGRENEIRGDLIFCFCVANGLLLSGNVGRFSLEGESGPAVNRGCGRVGVGFGMVDFSTRDGCRLPVCWTGWDSGEEGFFES